MEGSRVAGDDDTVGVCSRRGAGGWLVLDAVPHTKGETGARLSLAVTDRPVALGLTGRTRVLVG